MSDLYGAVEGGGTKFRCAVGTGPFDVRAEARVPTTDPATTLARVAQFFAPYRNELRALGVCTFGPLELDPHAGDSYGGLLRTPKLAWAYAPLRATLARALELPIAIDTDVNGAALAEQRWGAAVGVDPVVYVTVGTGVGVGVVIEGRPLHGLLHPELGHIRIERALGDRFAGACPYHGACVEGLVSAPALRARAGKAPESLGDDDPLWDIVAHDLAALLHTIVLAYAPRRIVLGGGVMERAVLRPKILACLLSSLSGYVPRDELSEASVAEYVVAPGLGDRAGLLGGFVLAERVAGNVT